MISKKLLMTPLLAVLVLAGCASVPVSEPHALPATPASFKHKALPASATLAQADWWKTFADPQLDALTERALAHNTSLQQASARLAQARALLRSTEANRALQLGASAG
ncbi:RND transporter, partial [Paucibacter sp. XJ19-41]|nr:RND transporter [Paucibacter sp. XJ19-41]